MAYCKAKLKSNGDKVLIDSVRKIFVLNFLGLYISWDNKSIRGLLKGKWTKYRPDSWMFAWCYLILFLFMGYLQDKVYKMNTCPKRNSIWENFGSYMSRTSRQPLSLEGDVCVCVCVRERARACVYVHVFVHMHI